MLNDFKSFQITKELSAQTGHTAYLAHDTSTNKEVVIKELPVLLTEQLAVEAYLSKTNVKSLHSEKFIAETYSIEQNDGKSYFVREYLDRPSLETALLSGKFDLPTLISLFLAVAKAINILHKNGYHHLNLKPSNIFILPENRFCFTDSYPIDHSTLLKKSDFVRSTSYTSPELLNDQEITDAADIYSLGIIYLQLISSLKHDPVKSLSLPERAEIKNYTANVTSQVPSELRLMLEMMVAENHTERMRSTEILISTLQFLKSADKGKMTESEDFGKSSKKETRQYLAISLLVVLIIIFWIVVTSMPE